MLKAKHLLLCGLLLVSCSALHAWGFWAHKRINRLAVFTLPPEMLVLYKTHLEYITEHAVGPDERRYAVDGEAPKHFIDIDHYGRYPFDNVPRDWDQAVQALSEDTLQAYGILPYQLPREFYKLQQAFEDQDLGAILRYSADIGHYIGDAHVPLHTTENYNGQLSGQKGIHAFWESRLPELFGERYDFFVGRCYYIDNVYKEGWDAVLESHLALDSVLRFEQQLNDRFAADKKYGYESRNNITVRAYSREYSSAYHQMLSGMVERRMCMAIKRIGAYWYTAWQNAGSPDLHELVGQDIDPTPNQYEKRLNIIDREAFDIEFLFAPLRFPQQNMCCSHSPRANKSLPMGWKRTMSCVTPYSLSPTPKAQQLSRIQSIWNWVNVQWNKLVELSG
ncbi:MAG: zinc dependent phospholipase C family protein [Bacteroidota bacterium]